MKARNGHYTNKLKEKHGRSNYLMTVFLRHGSSSNLSRRSVTKLMQNHKFIRGKKKYCQDKIHYKEKQLLFGNLYT